MSGFFLGEIKLVPYNFAPKYWANCNGQILSIAQNTALFSLLGTTYGGNGTTTFALPDLRGRVAVGQSQGPGLSNRTLGEVLGTETVTLTSSTLPSHSHGLTTANAKPVMGVRKDAPTSSVPNGGFIAGANIYIPKNAAAGPDAGLHSTTVGFGQGATTDSTGGNQPHANVQPYLVLKYIIATSGIFPSRN